MSQANTESEIINAKKTAAFEVERLSGAFYLQNTNFSKSLF